MQKLILAVTILTMAGIAPCVAHRGHGHSAHDRSMHGHSMHAMSGLANPVVPPSRTPDARLTGSVPLPAQHQMTNDGAPSPMERDPEDEKLDQTIKSICRGC
jgi:hypothetical protein